MCRIETHNKAILQLEYRGRRYMEIQFFKKNSKKSSIETYPIYNPMSKRGAGRVEGRDLDQNGNTTKTRPATKPENLGFGCAVLPDLSATGQFVDATPVDRLHPRIRLQIAASSTTLAAASPAAPRHRLRTRIRGVDKTTGGGRSGSTGRARQLLQR